MFCENCGTQLQEGTRFCTKCGQPVMQNIPTYEIVDTQGQQTSVRSNRKLLTGIVIAMSAIVVVLVVVIVSLLVLTKKQEVEVARTTVVQHSQEDKGEKETVEEKSVEEVAPSQETVVEEMTVQEETVVEETSVAQETTEQRTITDAVYQTLAPAEQVMADKIEQINGANYSLPTINVYEENYTPGVRDYNGTWDSRVFYQVEGIVNQSDYYNKNNCILVKKQLWTAASRNQIDYEIYLNPMTGRPNKIISLEYLFDGMEITEYYYTNEGTISFIFQYYTDNYISSYATPSMSGNRFLFHQDSMVTWRVIEFGTTTNYVLGAPEANRMKNQFPANTMQYYNNMTDDKRSAFDEMEKKMINAAYNTYYNVMNAQGVALIQGYVNNADGVGIEDAEVVLFAHDFTSPLYQASTDSSGKYYIYVPNEDYDYNMRISKNGFSNSDIYDIAMSNEQVEASQDTVYLFTPDMGNADVELKLGDALNYAADGTSMEALNNANIYVRNGLNNKMGQVIHQAQSDGNGSVTMSLAPGMYTVEVVSAGFENMYYNIQSNPKKTQNFYEFYATPDLEEGEIRIVLTWGQTPRDLDSHLFTITGNTTDHIWYGDRYDINGSNLDVDDISSYGPETVTIPSFSNDNYYKYCVTDFTNCASGNYNSQEMSYSDACVNVYGSSGLIATFHVPAAREGVIWEVFEIRKGDITPIQRYYNNVEDKSWWSHE